MLITIPKIYSHSPCVDVSFFLWTTIMGLIKLDVEGDIIPALHKSNLVLTRHDVEMVGYRVFALGA